MQRAFFRIGVADIGSQGSQEKKPRPIVLHKSVQPVPCFVFFSDGAREEISSRSRFTIDGMLDGQ